MKYLFDTNCCIYGIKGSFQSLTDRLMEISPGEIAISTITLGELEYGAAKSKWGDRTRNSMKAFLSNFPVLEFTEGDARVFGTIRATLELSGNKIGLLDAMIGAQGVNRGLTVVTHNVREFVRIPGIILEDWCI
ncbi:MAG: type II toxin-antitoxin system VapC family toxin [Lachnospiraceae bacterium]|nr:type II toxin-antitoxin system VapC family toxin [Lachnospiraceae bacterium]